MNEQQQNPFTGSETGNMAQSRSGGALAQTDQQRAIAEVQAAMLIARTNPRNQIQAMDRILNACTRPTLADAAIYQYSRGGSDISGPSIRLAEAIAQQWGNVQFGIRELEQRDGESTVQAFAWDVETNVRREMVFQVSHERHTKNGSKRLTDPRDIYEMVANQGARRVRSCILGIIPGDVVEAAVHQCEVTMKSKADTSPEAVAKMLEAFASFGVSKEQIEKRIQRRIDAIQPAQIVSLKKVYASLRDGMSTAADWFEAEAPLTEQVKRKSEKPAAPAEAEPAGAAQPAAPAEAPAQQASAASEQPEAPASANTKDYSFEELIGFVEEAETAATIDWIEGLPSKHLTPTQARSVKRAIEAKRKTIGGAA